MSRLDSVHSSASSNGDDDSSASIVSSASSVSSSAPLSEQDSGVPSFFLPADDESEQQGRQALYTAAHSFNRDRDQRRRRLISQRKLGEGTSLGDVSSEFQLRREVLPDDDAALLMTFSNADLFYRLLHAVEEGRTEAKPLDLLAQVNPYFRYLCTLQVDPAVVCERDAQEKLLTLESSLLEEHIRPVVTQVAVRRRVPLPKSAPGRSRVREASKNKHGSSAPTSGVMQASLQNWERYLEKELHREGETLQNFRRNTAKESYVEKEQFKEQAIWNEYVRELELQERERKIQDRKRQRSEL